MCGRSAGRSGGRTMVFAPGLSHVYRAYRRKIPALVLGGPPFILSSRSGAYSSAPPLLSLSKAVSFTCVGTREVGLLGLMARPSWGRGSHDE